MRHVQLRAFHHVARLGGFSRAAEALSLTQPAISDQVRRLEAQYDVVLFNRARKQVTLTEAGERLYAVTKRLFETESQALELLTETRALRSGALRLVADSANHVLHLLRRFGEIYPGVDLSIRAGNSGEVLALLMNYQADVGVLGSAPPGRSFLALQLGESPLIAFVARGHPLAGRNTATLAEIAAHPLVLREKGSKTREAIAAEFGARHLPVRAKFEVEGREAVRDLVASGLGVGVVSQAEFRPDDGLWPIRLADCSATMTESLVCLRERAGGRLVKAFFDLARG